MKRDIYSSFVQSCHENGRRPLIIEPENNIPGEKTYFETLNDVHHLMGYLQGLSLSKGERIALLAENRFEWWVVYFAAVALGLIVVPLDGNLPPETLKEHLLHSKSRLLFITEAMFHKLSNHPLNETCLEQIIFLDEMHSCPIASRSFAEILNQKAIFNETAFVPPEEEDGASLIYTSGTTGEAKGVLLSHKNLVFSGQAIRRLNMGQDNIHLVILPLHHVYGFTVSFSILLMGGTLLFTPDYKQTTLSHLLTQYRPHFIETVPAFLERWAQGFQAGLSPFQRVWISHCTQGRLGNSPFIFQKFKKFVFRKVLRRVGGRIKSISSGGAPLDPSFTRIFNLLGIPVTEGYGLSETSPLLTSNDVHPDLFRWGSVGKPVTGLEIKIERPDSSGAGEICARGPAIMKEYFQSPEETNRVIDAEGWFHTGDVGRFDAEGFLYITGRKKDLIVTSGGKNVSPESVENHFARSPLIQDFCVYGIPRPHGLKGELIHLQVVPNSDEIKRLGIAHEEEALKEEIRRLSSELPEYQRPQSIGFSSDPFPRTTTYKIKRFLVREEFLKRISNIPPLSSVNLKTETPAANLVQNVLKTIIPELPPINSASSLTLDLGMDSLQRLDFWTHLEEILETPFPEEKTIPLNSIGSIVEFLSSHPSFQEWHRRERSVSPHSSSHSFFIGSHNKEMEIRDLAKTTLQSYPKLRSLFLKGFRRFFNYFSHLRVQGLENLPASGPYILAPNHQSHLDNLFVACFLPPTIQQNMAVLGKKEHYDHWWTRLVAKICHMIPVDREHVSQKVLHLCGEILEEGHILLIHPEGTRSPDGHLLPFKDGVAHLACHHQCPVVPVYIEGSHEFWPKDSILPRHRSRITVTLLQPLPPPSCLENDNPRQLQEKVHQITKELWNRVALFSGEDVNSSTPFESMTSATSRQEGGRP